MFPIPFVRKVMLRTLPIDILNAARLPDLGADFTELADLPLAEAETHIFYSEPKTCRAFVRAYWAAVHAKLIECGDLSVEKDGLFPSGGFEALLDHWHALGRLPYAEKNGVKYIHREDLRKVLTANHIPFPVTGFVPLPVEIAEGGSGVGLACLA